MNRREALRLLLAGAVGTTVKLPEFPIWNPHPAQIKFLTAQDKLLPALWGIPYHQSNASTGAWLGITRSTEAYKQLGKLVQLLEEDKKNEGNNR